MPADRDRIELDLTECLRRLRIARDTDDADAEWYLADALDRLFELWTRAEA